MRICAWLVAGLSLAATGCAGMRPVSWPEDVAKQGVVQVPVTFFPQERYQCGPAALAMALDWSGLKATPKQLVDQVYTASREGSLQPAMIAAARRHGRVAYVIHGLEPLVAELTVGHPVIVLQNLSLPLWPRWHYAVVIGVAPGSEDVLLHSGTTPHKRMDLRTFMNTWRRGDTWGLLVLPPDELPATVDKSRWVRAVSGLERAGQLDAARIGYRTALSRWPGFTPAWMGLGNTHHAMGALEAAEGAYRRALELDPGYALAWNNLAQTLADQGRTKEAIAAAKRAVDLGGPYQETFRQTLRSILTRQGNR